MLEKTVHPRGNSRPSGGHYFDPNAILRILTHDPCKLTISFEGIRSLTDEEADTYLNNLFVLRAKGFLFVQGSVCGDVGHSLDKSMYRLQESRSVSSLVKRMVLASGEGISKDFLEEILTLSVGSYLKPPEDATPLASLGNILHKYVGRVNDTTSEDTLELLAIYCNKSVDQIRRDFASFSLIYNNED